MIKITNIRKTYQMGDTAVPALRGVNLTIEPGEFVAVMGPSGSGKSTLMHTLGLLDVPDSGVYELLGKDVAKFSEDDLAALRARTIGFVFQQFNLLARTSALENVELPLLYSANGRDPARPRKLLQDVGLGARLHHKPNELSGGQQQRVAIARALANDPRILMADEPTGNLDSHSEKEIMALLCDLNERGITVVLVTHETEIAEHAKRIIRMRDGMIQTDEPTERVRGRSSVQVREKTRAEVSLPATRRSALNAREMAEHFRQAGRALLANKVRTGLSMLGILIGVAAVIAMLALGKGAQKSIEARLSSMGTNLLAVRAGSRFVGGVATGAGAAARFTREDAKEIAASVPGVKRVTAGVDGRGQVTFGSKNWNTEIMGTTAEYAPMRAAVPVAGRFFTEEEDRSRARVAVLGMTLVRELFGDANPLGEIIKINRINFQVIGVLPERGATGWRDQDDVILIPLSTAMRRVMGESYVEDIDVEVESADRMAAVEEGIRDLIVRRHRLPPSQEESFRIRNLAEMQEVLSETSRTMTLLLAVIAAISLLVGGIGIMNIMLVSVTERTREIGLRKALGARRSDILSQFLIESVAVSVLGGVFGIILGWGITLAMSAVAGWATSVSPGTVLLAFCFSAGVGVVFGFWPAKKAAALNPIVALRYE